MNKGSQKKKEITLDDLAMMVQKGFLGVEERLDTIEIDVAVLKTDVKDIKADVAVLKTDVKDIKANLNKKVDKVDHNTLTYRVEKLEKEFA